MLDFRALIEKHRANGVLVDANLLVLRLVGRVNKRRILEFKRTRNFSVEDFDLLEKLVAWLGKLTTTPQVRAQVSDLTDLPGKELSQIRSLFKTLVEQNEESYDPSACLLPIQSLLVTA